MFLSPLLSWVRDYFSSKSVPLGTPGHIHGWCSVNRQWVSKFKQQKTSFWTRSVNSFPGCGQWGDSPCPVHMPSLEPAQEPHEINGTGATNSTSQGRNQKPRKEISQGHSKLKDLECWSSDSEALGTLLVLGRLYRLSSWDDWLCLDPRQLQ